MNARRIAVVASVTLALLASALVTHLLRPPHTQRAATALRAAEGVRARQIQESNEQLFDSGYETCAALGLTRLARQYALPRVPEPAARAYAAQFEPAMRAGTYRGCVKALRESAGSPQ